ncbi:hypothetical protein [Yersinia pseudotuberculosis]|uniref:hypothetical protein n=1 Tax=Yersinia pseudotuberculosis TaxID=633 RepID=UPI0005DAB3C0|nr:hypothetical protein [Yersinia pseudotuberculosis]CNC98196.1 Uncharacterised protein [Yersinia pseudotuberculosis]
MSQAVKTGDIGTDHDGFPATAVIGGSSTVKADNKAMAWEGDILLLHRKSNYLPHLIIMTCRQNSGWSIGLEKKLTVRKQFIQKMIKELLEIVQRLQSLTVIPLKVKKSELGIFITSYPKINLPVELNKMVNKTYDRELII